MQITNRVQKYVPRTRRYDTCPIKRGAQQKVRYAVARGTLKKPPRCEGCKREREPRGLEGHHFVGYELALEVVFLCRECHAFQHALEARIKKLGYQLRRENGEAQEAVPNLSSYSHEPASDLAGSREDLRGSEAVGSTGSTGSASLAGN